MSTKNETSRIEALINGAEFSKALYVLRDALARNPRNESLMKLAADLANAAENKAMILGCNKATEGSRQLQEIESIAAQAREYLTP
jgi:hypothetical protein